MKSKPRPPAPASPPPPSELTVWAVERAWRRLAVAPSSLTTAPAVVRSLVDALETTPDGLDRRRAYQDFTSTYADWAAVKSRVDVHRPPPIEPAPLPSAAPPPTAHAAEQTLAAPGRPRPKPAVADSPKASAVEVLVRKRDLADAMQISTRQLDRLVASGEFPTADAVLGRAPRWKAATYARWLAEQGGVR